MESSILSLNFSKLQRSLFSLKELFKVGKLKTKLETNAQVGKFKVKKYGFQVKSFQHNDFANYTFQLHVCHFIDRRLTEYRTDNEFPTLSKVCKDVRKVCKLGCLE